MKVNEAAVAANGKATTAERCDSLEVSATIALTAKVAVVEGATQLN
jgi:hypothetical protein